ncbi:MAG TPA: hypothetical protein VFR81_02460, partial [Longimicrobium sp.]|nr:hypothetical protein [Longimicrobium sp.]
RALRDGVLQWSDEVRERARRTVDDLRAMVSGHGSGGGDDTRAQEAAARWDGVGAGRARGEQPAAGDHLFAFLRREIAGVVGEMDRALGALEADPAAKEPLRAVLRRMRPVRGVAGMDTLSPVLEVLEGIEDAAHEVLGRAGAAEGRQLELLAAGRGALAAAGAALERGDAVGDSAELTLFRELRDRAEGDVAEADGVLPISALFFDDAGPHVLSSPLAPVAEEEGKPALLADVEAFLRIEATGFLDRAEGLVAGLAQRPKRFARIARQLSELASGVGDLAVTYGMTMIASAAQQAVERLGRAVSAEDARSALRSLRASLPGAAPLAETAVEVEPDADAVVPASASPSAAISAPAEDGVVPVEALLYDPDDALREALRLRPRLEAAVRGTELGEALDELFALVERGLAARAA